MRSILHPQSEAFFEARYRQAADPWHFESSQYELERYRATLAALSQPSYQSGYEPGCSIGVLTELLAARCRRLLASDIAATAVCRARERCKALAHVTIAQGDVADVSSNDTFDLIVFSEIGYYFDASTLQRVASDLVHRLLPAGEFVAVHWLGHSVDHVLHGDEVHAVLAAGLGCDWIGGSRDSGFRIDSWRKL